MVYLAYCPVGAERESAAAHGLLERLYRRAFGEPMPPLVYAENGKPGFAADNRFCSIAHTRRSAFCAVSDEPVGLDAEQLDRAVRLVVARRVLSPAEEAVFARADDPRLALLRYWTLKEAYLKYTGEGLRRDMRTLTFTFADRLPCLAGHTEHFCQTVSHGCLVALCTPSPFILADIPSL